MAVYRVNFTFYHNKKDGVDDNNDDDKRQNTFLLQGLNLIFNDSLLLILKTVVFVLYIFCNWLHTFRRKLFSETAASTRTLVAAYLIKQRLTAEGRSPKN